MLYFILGDPETWMQHPASITHSSIPEESLAVSGVSKGLIRCISQLRRHRRYHRGFKRSTFVFNVMVLFLA